MVERLIFVARNNGFKRNDYVMGNSPLNLKVVGSIEAWATSFGNQNLLSPDIFETLFPEACWLECGGGSVRMAVEVTITHTVLGLWDEGVVIDPEQKGD